MSNIAIVSFSNPFVDKKDGGKIDIINRIKCIHKLNIKIDHYSLLKKNEKTISNNLVEKNIVGKINNKFLYMLSLFPISVNNRYNKRIHNQLLSNKYNWCLIENFNMIRYIEGIDEDTQILLRVHNIESLSRYELFKSNKFSVRGILELIESIKYKWIERSSLKKVDKFLFISQDEMKYFEKKYPKYNFKYEWLPSVIETNKIETVYDESEEEYILYYGDLTVSHNIIGIKIFLEYVYPKIYKARKIKLNIAGKINETDREELNKNTGVNVLGYVDDLDKYIAQSKFVIAPIYTGAGVKIKVIDAISKGKVLITTPKGIEGTGLIKDENVLCANNFDEYYNYCIRALNNDLEIELISKRGYEFIKKYYTEEYNMRKLNELLNLIE